MKRLSALLLLLFFFSNTEATNYYFSTSLGVDSRTSVQAQSQSTPWKTLSKLSSFFSSLLPGDSVFLKKGEVFPGSIVVGKSGTVGSRIYIGGYGTGTKPVITSLVLVTGWISKGNGVYESALNSSLGSIVNCVTINDIFYERGRYPNSDAANGGYLTFETHIGNTSITDNTLPAIPGWAGADAVVRCESSVLETRNISTHSAGQLTFTTPLVVTPTNNFGYFFTNSLKTLDRHGEWFYNPSTQKMSIYLSSLPSNYVIKASTGSALVSSSAFNYIVFDSLDFESGNQYGVNVSSGTGFKFTACDFNNAGINTIKISSHTAPVIQYCTFNNSMAGAIYLNACNSAIVRYNNVRNTMTHSGMMGDHNNGAVAAIFVVGLNGLIEYNRVINSGYIGIRWKGDGNMIRYNLVDTFTITKSDGGGIYYYNGATFTTDSSTIKQNIVLHGIGAPLGSAAGPSKNAGDGLYSDNGTAHSLWIGNTVAFCNKGMFSHYGTALTIRDNTFFDNRLSQQELQMQKINLSRKLVVKGNIYFAVLPTTKVITFLDDSTDIKQLGIFDSNYICRPKFEPIGISNASSVTTGGTISFGASSYFSLDKWMISYSPWEAHSKKTAKAYDTLRFEYNASSTDSIVILKDPTSGRDYTYLDPKGKRYKGTLTLSPFTSVILIRDTIVPIVGPIPNIPPTAVLTSPANGATYTPPASISLVATATDTDGTITKVNFFSGSTLIGTDNTSPYGITWTPVGAGVYSLTAHPVDNSGDSTISPAISVTVANPVGNKIPTIAITSPLDSTYFSSPASIRFIAVASDSDGTISGGVRFYKNGTLFWSETASPYDFITTFTTGEYIIRAITKDNSGDSATSAPITIFVNSLPPLKANVSIDTIRCNGGTATITIDATGGTPPYTGTGVTTHTVGSYTYPVGDAASGHDTIRIVVTQPTALSATNTPGTITLYGGSASVTINASGGTVPREYQLGATGIWQSSNIFPTVYAGSYIVNVRDANGCTTSTSFTLTQPAANCNCLPHRGHKFK